MPQIAQPGPTPSASGELSDTQVVAPAITVISPMHNEAENVDTLLEELERACTPLGPFEVILVDDGSTDDTANRIAAAQRRFPWLRLVQHPRAAGQSAAIHSGVMLAHAPLICTLDGDGQNPPDQIPALLLPFGDGNAGPGLAQGQGPSLGLVAGQRVGRRDTLSKRLASRLANALRSGLLGDGTRDTGCGLKAFRRDAYLALPFFNHMHRYLPALFKRDGWGVAHVDVTHRARGAGQSKYSNIQRAFVGISDILAVAWLIRRRKTAVPVEHVPATESANA